jgi:hypothetical protein
MHMVSVLSASLLAPSWPRYLPPTACDDKHGSLMIIYSDYPLFLAATCISVLLVFPCVICRQQKKKKREEGKEDSLL